MRMLPRFHMTKSVRAIAGMTMTACLWNASAWGQEQVKTQSTPQEVQIPNDLHYWENAGFAEMVPPVRLPSDKDHLESIRVWLRVPEDQKISVSWVESQSRYSLIYPPGTVADRVDSSKSDPASTEGVDDVRGARIDERSNTIFHDYETVPGESPDWLKGYEWKRDGDNADKAAADALVSLFFPKGYNWDPAVIRQFRQLNQCAACHQADAPAPTTTAPPFRFESDSRGFFQPMTVLQNSMTVRDHRQWDLNADDPFVTVWCGDQQTYAVVDGDTRKYECPGEIAPIGKLDIIAALKEHDPHAEQVCSSRNYLYLHMDIQARTAFKPMFEDCNISSN